MDVSCPNCNRQLPEVETLEYRFCPHCGAEITTEPEQLDQAFLTIPPDLPPPEDDEAPRQPKPVNPEKIPDVRQFDDPAIQPQPVSPQKLPQIKPPASPPPTGFVRKPPRESTPGPSKIPPNEQPAKNPKKVIIAVLILLVVAVLVLGGLFTF